MNLVAILVAAILALTGAVKVGSAPQPSGITGAAGVSISATPTPAPTNPPARYDVIGAGGPT